MADLAGAERIVYYGDEKAEGEGMEMSEGEIFDDEEIRKERFSHLSQTSLVEPLENMKVDGNYNSRGQSVIKRGSTWNIPEKKGDVFSRLGTTQPDQHRVGARDELSVKMKKSSSVKSRLGVKRVSAEYTEEKLDCNDGCDVIEWDRKLKRPRLGMVADLEQGVTPPAFSSSEGNNNRHLRSRSTPLQLNTSIVTEKTGTDSRREREPSDERIIRESHINTRIYNKVVSSENVDSLEYDDGHDLMDDDESVVIQVSNDPTVGIEDLRDHLSMKHAERKSPTVSTSNNDRQNDESKSVTDLSINDKIRAIQEIDKKLKKIQQEKAQRVKQGFLSTKAASLRSKSKQKRREAESSSESESSSDSSSSSSSDSEMSENTEKRTGNKSRRNESLSQVKTKPPTLKIVKKTPRSKVTSEVKKRKRRAAIKTLKGKLKSYL